MTGFLRPSQSLYSFNESRDENDPDIVGEMRFNLFSADWLMLQRRVESARGLPETRDVFDAQYGVYPDQPIFGQCYEAMKDLRSSALDNFGGPAELRTSILESASTGGSTNYGSTFYGGLGKNMEELRRFVLNLEQLSNPRIASYWSKCDKESVKVLKAYLLGKQNTGISAPNNGLAYQSDQIGREFNDLAMKLEKALEAQRTYEEQLRKFTGESSEMVAATNKAIGEAKANIKKLTKDREAAYDAWLGFTIAAVTTSVGVAVIGTVVSVALYASIAASAAASGGMTLALAAPAVALQFSTIGIAAGLASGLGAKAASERASYDQLGRDLAAARETERKAINLGHDLAGLEAQMKRLDAEEGVSGEKVLKDVRAFGDVFTDLAQQLQGHADNLTVNNISDSPLANVDATADLIVTWTPIKDLADQFGRNMLVDYRSGDLETAVKEVA